MSIDAEHRRDPRADLQAVQAAIVRLTAQLYQLEGHRDRLIGELLDLEGAHDRRAVGVR